MAGLLDMPDQMAQPPDPSFGLRSNPYLQNIAQMLVGMGQNIGSIPQRAFQSSNAMQAGQGYDPRPILDAAMLPMGTGALAGLPMRAGEMALGAGPIRAYHGSPYDFDRFDLSKIGTGEGAQAYGHGLYFAENPATAQAYKENLGVFPEVNKLSFNPDKTPNRAGQVAGDLHAGISPSDIARGLKALEPNASEGQIQSWINEGRSMLEQVRQKAGKTYEVAINADPEHFLDWDKPLSKQHPRVQEALAKLPLPNTDVTANSLVRNYLPDVKYAVLPPEGGASFVPAKASNYQDALAEAGGIPGNLRIIHDNSPEAASRQLREAGIPGIKYLDQGSRVPTSGLEDQLRMVQATLDAARADPSVAKTWGGIPALENDLARAKRELEANKATRNYVVFDDKLIDIARKYGLAGLMGTGIYSQMQQQPR